MCVRVRAVQILFPAAGLKIVYSVNGWGMNVYLTRPGQDSSTVFGLCGKQIARRAFKFDLPHAFIPYTCDSTQINAAHYLHTR